MKYLPVITLGVLCAAGPALHSCNDRESQAHQNCNQLLQYRHPVPRPWTPRRARRSLEEPVGSQASPFAPPEASSQTDARPKAKPLPRSGRTSGSGGGGSGGGSSSGPFTPPEEKHEVGNSRKKSQRGGWEPHDDDDHHHGHVVEEEVVEEEEEEPYVDEYKPPLLNPAHDGHVKIKSHRPPPDPHWSEKSEHHPWDDKHHHDDHGWKEEAQYKINDVKLRIPPVKFRFHLSPNVKIISGSSDPLQRPPPPEPEEHFPWEKPKDLPRLPWWPDEEWPEKRKNCTEESNRNSPECRDQRNGSTSSESLSEKSETKKSVEKRKGSDKSKSSPLKASPKASSKASPKASSKASPKTSTATNRSRRRTPSATKTAAASKKKPASGTGRTGRNRDASKKKKDRVTKRTGEPEAAASSRHQHQVRLKPRRRSRKRKGWASEAYDALPASPWSAPRPTWGDGAVIEEHVDYDGVDDDDDDHHNDGSKNAHRGSDAEGDANNNGTGGDPPINWQDSPIHFAAHKRRWPADTPRYSPTFKLKVSPRIWTEAPPTTTTTTTEATTTTEDDQSSNEEESTTETSTTEEGSTDETTTASDDESTTETTTDGETTTDSGETTTRFREPTTPDQEDSTPMPSTTTTDEEPTTTTTTTTASETTTAGEAPTTSSTTTTSTTTEEPTTTEMPSTTLAITTTTEETTTTTLPTTAEESTTQLSNSDAPLRKKGSRIPKVFSENDVRTKGGREKSTTPLPPSTTVSGTTTSWLFGLTNTTTEFNPSLEREDPQKKNPNRTGAGSRDLPHPRRRLVPLSPVKIDVSSPEELAGVAVNAKVLHLFLGGPNSTSLHDSVVTVAKAVNQYNNYYKRR